MSSGEDSGLKGGHAPAVKAGGMRITQHKEKETKHRDKETTETPDSVLKVSTSPPKSMTISGAPVRGHADFPTEAVQSFHAKIQPTHDAKVAAGKPNVIHQPRK